MDRYLALNTLFKTSHRTNPLTGRSYEDEIITAFNAKSADMKRAASEGKKELTFYVPDNNADYDVCIKLNKVFNEVGGSLQTRLGTPIQLVGYYNHECEVLARWDDAAHLPSHKMVVSAGIARL